MIEPLEARLTFSGGAGGLPLIDPATLGEAIPTLLAGLPGGSPADSPDNRIDPNTTDSPYGGVGFVFVLDPVTGRSFLGSGTVISRYHVLTAAHLVDLDDDGQPDVGPQDVTFGLNFGADFSHVIVGSEVSVHPDFTGFANPTINDDLAIIKLAEPLPPEIPVYPIWRGAVSLGDELTLVGYGASGDPASGYTVIPDPAVKRMGKNRYERGIRQDESNRTNFAEGFLYDFDGPDLSTNIYPLSSAVHGKHDYPIGTLGNDVETLAGPGDSGGPAFIVSPNGELAIFGINTFGRPPRNVGTLFSSQGGGIILSSYPGWIDSVVGGGHGTPGAESTPPAAAPFAESGFPAVPLSFSAATPWLQPRVFDLDTLASGTYDDSLLLSADSSTAFLS